VYATIDSMGEVNVNKFEIASKISKNCFIAYHSALEYYGLTNQVFNNVIIGCSNKMSNFTFEDINYEFYNINNYNDIYFDERRKVRVTSLERTIIDCIHNIDLAGGIEELLQSLDLLNFIDENKLIKVLCDYNQVLLFQKVGYILEYFKYQLNLSQNFFEYCKSKLTNQVKYFLTEEYDDICYSNTWKLMAPRNLLSIYKGG